MTAPNLLDELEEVVRLMGKATPGEWLTEYRKNPQGYAQEVFDDAGDTIATMAWHAVPFNETTTTTDREANAHLIARSVNFLRTHHATLADMTKRLEAAERDAAEVQALLPGVYYMDPPDGGSVTVIEQLRRMTRDAARYRWLRVRLAGAAHVKELEEYNQTMHSGLASDVDAAIDAHLSVAEAPEPDPALLASMATCLHHGFGMLDASQQRSMLNDMRKLWDEVMGRGYYRPENRGRYMAYVQPAVIATTQEGEG